MEKKSGFLCQSKNFYQIGQRQKLRRIRTLKQKAEIDLWFLQSHGLELSYLKIEETSSGQTHLFNFNNEEVNPESGDESDQVDAKNSKLTDQNNLETLLFLSSTMSYQPYQMICHAHI